MVMCASATFAQQPPPCGASLFAPSLPAGKTIDAVRPSPRTPCYQAPTSIMPDEPGALVRAKLATDFDLPPGVKASSILYHTRTANNADTSASGVVLIPYGRPKDGWSLLAWSHGTSVATKCAPSFRKSVFYNWKGLYEYVKVDARISLSNATDLATRVWCSASHA